MASLFLDPPSEQLELRPVGSVLHDDGGRRAGADQRGHRIRRRVAGEHPCVWEIIKSWLKLTLRIAPSPSASSHPAGLRRLPGGGLRAALLRRRQRHAVVHAVAGGAAALRARKREKGEAMPHSAWRPVTEHDRLVRRLFLCEWAFKIQWKQFHCTAPIYLP